MDLKEYGAAIAKLPEWWDGVACEETRFTLSCFDELIIVHEDKAPMIYRNGVWLAIEQNGSIFSGTA